MELSLPGFRALARGAVGTMVKLTLDRGGKALNISVRLRELV